MFRVQPEFYTAKELARALKITPRAITLSIKRTGKFRGVKIPHRSGELRIPSDAFWRIVNCL